jgi:hypothetical protein
MEKEQRNKQHKDKHKKENKNAWRIESKCCRMRNKYGE